MAVGYLQISRGYCRTCNDETKLVRNTLVWGFGDFVLVVISLGLWVALKFAIRPSWRCFQCGSKV